MRVVFLDDVCASDDAEKAASTHGQGSQETGEKPGVEYDAAIRGKHLAACVEKIDL